MIDVIVIIKNKNGHYLPMHDFDLPIFKHCFEGSIEVTEKFWKENRPILNMHGYKYEIVDEAPTATQGGA